jgi:hypothetical protein
VGRDAGGRVPPLPPPDQAALAFSVCML